MEEMNLQNWREVFRIAALKLELADVELDEYGCCSLVSPQAGMPKINLVFSDEAGVVDVFAELGTVPDGDSELYRELLFDNLFTEKTKGATYAAARETGRIVLQRTFEVRSADDGDVFAVLLANFAEAAYAGRRLVYRSVLGTKEAAGDGMADGFFLQV